MIIHADFTPSFREIVAKHIKYHGVKRAYDSLVSTNVHPAFARAIVRSIIRKEGW